MNDAIRTQVLPRIAALLLVSFCAACSSAPKESPEDQIRALIAKGEKAAEDKDLGTLKDLVSETYRDEEGNRKNEIMKVLAFHLMRNASVHLLTRTRTIAFPDAKTAKATVFVAMAGGKLSSIQDLLNYRADLYRVDFTAVAEGRPDWRVSSAKWRPADTRDFEE